MTQPPTLDRLLRVYVALTGAPAADLTGWGQMPEISRLRNECIWALQQFAPGPFSDLGQMFGGRSVKAIDQAIDAVAMTDLMDQIGIALVSGAVDRIGTTNVSPEGVPWPQSLRVQIGGQAARPDDDFIGPMASGGGGPTLHLSGRLMRSITHLAAPREVEVGSNLIYAGVHQTGATIRAKTAEGLGFTLANGDHVVVGAVTLPPRPYLGISAGEADDIERLAAAYFGAPMGVQ